jgi:hypothetical protein
MTAPTDHPGDLVLDPSAADPADPADQPDPLRALRTFRPQLLALVVSCVAAVVEQNGMLGGPWLSSGAWATILTIVLAGALGTAARTIHTAANPAGDLVTATGRAEADEPDHDDEGGGAVLLEVEVSPPSPVLQPLRRDLVALLARNRIRVQHTDGGEEPYSIALRDGRAAVVVCAECDDAHPQASPAVRRVAELAVNRPELAEIPIVIVYTDRGKYGPVRDGNLILASSATVLRAVQQATAS